MVGHQRRVRLVCLVLGGLIYAALSMAAFAQSSVTSDEMTATVHDLRIAAAQKSGRGVWKWVVPPIKMKGGFGDHDPIGLVAGQLIPADCSINWIDSDTHKLYCVTSATSLVFFLDSPHTYLSRAERNWRALKGAGS
jgi:hypothetical protein